MNHPENCAVCNTPKTFRIIVTFADDGRPKLDVSDDVPPHMVASTAMALEELARFHLRALIMHALEEGDSGIVGARTLPPGMKHS